MIAQVDSIWKRLREDAKIKKAFLPMEPKEQELLSRYQHRLIDHLEPNDLLKHLVAFAALNEDDVQAITKKTAPREVQVERLLASLKRQHDGLRNLVKALLLSNTQDFLAREILGEENFGKYDIKDLLEELRDTLSEVQILKLELLEERKIHDNTKRELEEVKSNRNSMVFSDHDSSYCSGFDSSDTDTTGYLLRELEEEKRRRKEAEYLKSCQEQELNYLTKKTLKLEESQKRLLRLFKSSEDIRVVEDGRWNKRFPWKAASVVDLCYSDRPASLQNSSSEGTITKWRSDDSGAQLRKYSRNESSVTGEDETTGVLDLAERVSYLELELTNEKEKRKISEFEITKLESENKQLLFELEETRDQLLVISQPDLTQDSLSFDYDVWDDQYDGMDICADEYENAASSHGVYTLGRGFSCPVLNQNDMISSQIITRPHAARMRRPVSYHGSTNISNIWQNRNEEHYEMDEYEHEMEKKPDRSKTDLKYVLRRLKLKTMNLYHDIVIGSAELKILSNRAERLRSYNM